MSTKIHIDQAPTRSGSRYPPPYDAPCQERFRRCLGDAAGLTQFGVNLLRLPPGAWSSQRHWHASEDEFIYVVEGELVLVTNAGEQVLRVGDCAGFKAGIADGHHLQNRSGREALYLESGTRSATAEQVDYPDIDLRVREARFEHRDGTPYPDAVARNPTAGPK